MVKYSYKLLREKNRLLNQWEQYYRTEELKSSPVSIQFPTGSRCNIKCRFCTDRTGGHAKSDYKNLSFEEFRSTIENKGWHEALSCISVIALYGWGEPLVNPDYENIFDYIVNCFPELGVGICTNGVLFGPNWSSKIVSVSNSDVNFSVNAATKKTFKQLTTSNQFERVINNIRFLTDLREKSQTKNPTVSLSFVATTENIRELPQFVDLAVELNVNSVLIQDIMILNEETKLLSLSNAPDIAHEMSNLAEVKAKEANINYISFVTHNVEYFNSSIDPILCNDNFDNEGVNQNMVERELSSQIAPSPYFLHTDCFDPWENLMISENGDVYPCCRFQSLPETSLGNIFKQSLQDIWNGKGFRSVRKHINTGRPPAPCSICPRKSGHN